MREEKKKKPYVFGVNNYSGVHIKGLKNSVYDIKEHIKDLKIIDEIVDESDKFNKGNDLKYFNTVVNTNNKVFEFSDNIIKKGYLPILFGGDHSIAIGSISASSNNYDNIGIIWIDSHTDINTEETTVTKNIHGMPLAYLLGYGNNLLSNIGDYKPKIKPENIIYFGIRDVDPPEKEIIQKLNIKSYYYDEIRKRGIEICLKESLEYLNKCKFWHLQFDFDSMNPDIFPGVSVPVKDGFTKEEVEYIFNILLKSEKIIAIDLVEYNKSFDKDNISLNFAKKILDKILESFKK